MKKIKRIAALVCVFCLIGSLAGCGKLQVSREIATVNGRSITKAEYMYYLENIKMQMLSESGAEDAEAFWDAEIDGEKASEAAKKKALEEMLRVEIACIKAEEKGLSLSETEVQQIRTLVKLSDGEEKAQVEALKEMTGLTDDLFISLLNKTTLANIYAADINSSDPEALTPTDDEIQAAYEQKYVHVKHVLIGNSDENADTTDMSAEEIDAAATAYKQAQKAKAEEVLAKAKSGANFDALVREYGEDPGMEETPEGYTFTKGSMVPEFEDASYALAIGEVSDLVESSYGWHIIKKYALPTAGEEYDAAVQTVSATLSQNKYNALIDAYKSEMSIEIRQNVVDGVKVK